MFLTPSLRKKCLSMKKYNQLLNNSFSPKTTIYQNRLYLQQYDNIQPIIEDNFDDIIFIKKESTEKPNVKDESSKVSETTEVETTKETTKEETTKETTKVETDDKKTTEEKTDDKEITKEETTIEEEETSDNIPVLPATPSDNKKTIIISQKILDSANIKDNIFSDEEDNNDEELFGGKNNENSFF